MAKKKIENKNWKKIDTNNQLLFEQGGFLGLEEIDPNDYFLTDKNVDKIEKQQQEQQQQKAIKAKQQTKQTQQKPTKTTPKTQKNQKPGDKKRKFKKGNDDSDNEYGGFEDDSDDEISAVQKKPRIIKATETVDMSSELLNTFIEGTIHFKKKQRKALKVKQIMDSEKEKEKEKEEEGEEEEKEVIKPSQQQKQQKQKQQQPQKVNNKKLNKQDEMVVEEEEEQEKEQQQETEDVEEQKETKKPIKEKKAKTQKQIDAAKKNNNKLEKIKKRKEISEQKTISLEEQDQLDMSEWNSYNLDPLILKGLRSLGFSKPTEIQSSVIPVAVSSGYDIIGAAQTGSGKTLAFGIPMVQRILQHLRKHGQSVEKVKEQNEIEQQEEKEEKEDEEEEEEEEEEYRSIEYRKLFSLVICPTRELAIQVTNHIKSIISHTNLKVISIVGGMASQRQQRVLSKRPEIVVATPGRLWELITEGHQHLVELESLLCLGIDEADRMVEQGHFAELESILKTLPIHRTAMSKKERLKKKETEEKRNKRRKVDKLNEKGEMIKGKDEEDDEIPEEEMEELEQEEQNHLTTTHKRQTFVFSATLVNIPGDGNAPANQKKKYRKLSPIESLIEKVRFQRDYKLIDVTQKRLTAKNLLETKIFCNLEEKDMYLYYFVERYPGRTLVFVNSIDCARRLIPIFNILEVPVFSLHAQMQQKQRLKNLDRFRTLDNVVLIATDVAARGLDIPLVQHVIHYQVPRTTQLYIHRSGRTARSDQDGISVVLVTPKERPLYIKLDSSIEHDIGNFPIDLRYIEGVRDRIEVAKEIDQLSHKSQKENREKSWYKKQAEEMDIELDGDFFGENSDDEQSEDTRIAEQKKQFKLKQLRAELKHLLSRSLLPRGVSQSYITSSAIQELESKNKATASTDFSNKAKNVIGKKAKKIAIENHSKDLIKNKKK
ncbi:hypothetical protein RB653_006085 [Dictyostelium firmibasis]|uniref:RNA helicase n=1 Tax=Dictyostelium firmibasis TaxID=79012 RepID=A0AAN7UCV1_9MYCE